MAQSPYETGLDRRPANFQPLTPLSFLSRAALVNPEKLAIIHGPLRRTYAEFYARSASSPLRSARPGSARMIR